MTTALLGRDAGWQVQRRDDGKVSRDEIVHRYALPTLFGIMLAITAYAVSLPLLLWMAPVIVGLLLAIPIGLLSSTTAAGKAGRPPLLFGTPEQTSPPHVLVRANQLAGASQEAIGCPLLELRNDAELLEAHLNNLPLHDKRIRGQVNPHLAVARAKIEDARCLEEALEFLNSRETFAVLNSLPVLRALFELPMTGKEERLAIPTYPTNSDVPESHDSPPGKNLKAFN